MNKSSTSKRKSAFTFGLIRESPKLAYLVIVHLEQYLTHILFNLNTTIVTARLIKTLTIWKEQYLTHLTCVTLA